MLNIKPSYTTLDQNELLAKVVPDYLVDSPQTVKFWERGVNDTYQLQCANELYSLRVYRHELRTKDEIEFELAAMDHLRERGFALAYPIKKRDGGFITEIDAPEGVRYAVITTHAHGSDMDYSDAQTGRLFGASVAQLHNLTDDFQTPHKRPTLEVEFLLNDSVETVTPFLKVGSDELELLNTAAAGVRTAMENANLSEFAHGFCHGDIHGYNAHINDGVITHYDFDCCGMGFRLFDVATFIWNLWHHKNGGDVCRAFLDGYASARNISDEELAMLDTFIIMRHIWWMNLHTGNAEDFGYSIASEGAVNGKLKYIEHVLEGKIKKALAE